MSNNKMRLRRLEEFETREIIAQLDAEFVYARGRSGSLVRRFPSLMSEREPGGLFGGDIGGQICAAVAIKIRNYRDAGQVWSLGLVGLVWVHPEYRGKGVGQNLITLLNEHLRLSGLSAGVLWTGHHSLYGKYGWRTSDGGVVAEVIPREDDARYGEVICRPLSEADSAIIEQVRASSESGGLVRIVADYRTIPIPAAEVRCYYSMRGAQIAGYALAGWKQETAYLYEFLGDACAYKELYEGVERQANLVVVNSRPHEPLTGWLSGVRSAVWRAQEKAMWLPLANGLDMQQIRQWHIGYFDWI